MAWNDDIHGLVFRSNELKLYRPTHTWAMKLSQLNRQQGTVPIVTFRLPGAATDNYYESQIERRPFDMCVLIGTGGADQEREKAEALKALFPNVRIALHDALHVKAVAIAPRTLYVGSANFGHSTWSDITLGVRSTEAHDYFVNEIFEPLWAESTELDPG